MKRFRHHRDRGRLTSICETCGQTHTAIDAAVFRWQRSHECDTDKEKT